MTHLDFLDIPIYRICSDDFTNEMAHEHEKHLKWFIKETPDPKSADSIEISKETAEDYWQRNKNYMWNYNEIIGWISLTLIKFLPKGHKHTEYTKNNEVHGKIYYVKQTQIRKTPKKRFRNYKH